MSVTTATIQHALYEELKCLDLLEPWHQPDSPESQLLKTYNLHVIKPLHWSYNTKSETECMYRKAAAKSIHSKYLRLP